MLRCPGLPARLQMWPVWSLANISTKQPHSSHHALLYTEAQSGVNQLSPPGGADVCTKSRNVGKASSETFARCHKGDGILQRRSKETRPFVVLLVSLWRDTLAVLTDSSLEGRRPGSPRTCALSNSVCITLCMAESLSLARCLNFSF